MRETKFGPQPVKMMLRARGLSVAVAALEVGVTHPRLNGIVNGWLVPTVDVQEALEKLLGVPRVELFTDEARSHVDGRSVRTVKTCGCVCEVHNAR